MIAPRLAAIPQGARLALCAVLACLSLAFAAPAAQASYGFSTFDGGAFDASGNPDASAGSHPFRASATVAFNTIPNPDYNGDPLETPPILPDQEVRDVVTSLPPGLIGNPTAAPTCDMADFLSGPCPVGAQIGHALFTVGGPNPQIAPDGDTFPTPVYNLTPEYGSAAKFAFIALGVPVYLNGTLSKTPPYHAILASTNASQLAYIFAVDVSIWGDPADPAHDSQRQPVGPAGVPEAPFLSLPTSCQGPITTSATTTAWQGGADAASFLSHDLAGDPLAITGCDQLHFEPTLTAHPSTDVADAPSGLAVDLAVPQDQDPAHNATAHLRDTVVTLPAGMAINPASANGLDACTPAQIGLLSAPGEAPDFNGDPVTCPNASKLATVEVDTPLLDHPVPGTAYIAAPHQNPFNSLLALYIVLDDPATATLAKLAGEVHPDPDTGQLTTTFKDAPQVPFDHFKLNFKSGPHAPLLTPSACGDYSTTSSLTPWSAPDSGAPATPAEQWTISQGPGGSCATDPAGLPNSPAFDAGTVSPISKNYTPFVLHLRRQDGSQRFGAFNLTLPPGLTGKLAGTALCSDAALTAAASKSGKDEQSSPSCPLDSRVGSVYAAAGAGPDPYHVPGTAYLSAPYKGAPVSLAVITPAVAGPFDLGTIVIRTPLQIDPTTAQITALSDPIPQILEGIPTDVRSVDVVMDRPDFTLTGTSCDPSSIDGLLTSALGQGAPLSVRYQLSDCGRLPFKPKIRLSLKGKTKRGGHPALTVVLKTRPQDANISSLSLAMPRSEFLENAHIRTICTRPDFAADACPKGAVYGRATVTTPLLDYALSGNVYLRSSDNLLPDLVPDLRGPAYQPIRVESAGRTDSVRGGIRNTFDFIPDAPFTKLITKLPGGNKGLLVNSRDICRRAYRATVKYTAHNGDRYVDHPKLRVRCKGKGKKKHHKRSGHHRGSRR